MAPLKPEERGLELFPATNDYDDIAKKKIPMKSFEIFTLKKTEKRKDNSTKRLTGESVFSH